MAGGFPIEKKAPGLHSAHGWASRGLGRRTFAMCMTPGGGKRLGSAIPGTSSVLFAAACSALAR